MDRGNAKHGRHLDEEMKHEVKGIVGSGQPTQAEDWKNPESPDDDPADLTVRSDDAHTAGAPSGMTTVDLTRRAELASVLTPTAFPGTRSQLLQFAAGEAQWVSAELERLPVDRIFSTVGEVWEALGHPKESQRF
jgi:hypothetical protein